MRILVDDPLIREFVVEALCEAGYQIVHASTGGGGARQFADVLITDVMLPGKVDGWQIAERCREHDPGLPVIYASGFSPARPRPVPGSRSLTKPFSPDEIVHLVKELGDEG